MQGPFPRAEQIPSLLLRHSGAQPLPTGVRSTVVAMCACHCVVVQQIRSLQTCTGQGVSVLQARANELPESLRCLRCLDVGVHTPGGVGHVHKKVVRALKRFVAECAGEWLFVAELALEPRLRSSRRLDVLLLHTAARSWQHSIAIEIDPSQHGTNPMRYQQPSRAAGLQKVDAADSSKEQLCKRLGMRFFPISECSVVDGVLDSDWMTLLEREVSAINGRLAA